MNYKPAHLTDEQLELVQEYEQKLAQTANEPIILIAYADEEKENSYSEKKRP